MKKVLLLFLLMVPMGAGAQTASRSDGVTVYYYATIHEAIKAVGGGSSLYVPDEITILTDIILDEPLIVEDGIHIRIVSGNADVTIQRGSKNIGYPVIWVKGEGASLHLGKPAAYEQPGMENELFIDGGYLDNGIKAHAPLIALSGPDAKLFMFDKVFLQNNYNNGDVPGNSHYQNGAGVNIRTYPENSGRQAEFIMKGGTIRGNTNDVLSRVAKGGGVLIRGFGIFTMEGGVIKNNAAQMTGGGFHSDSRGSLKKTGGIIYGANAPAGFQNTALEGIGKPANYGHAVSISIIDHQFFQYRNDTVTGNEYLSYTGAPEGNGIFGEGEKWDNSDKNIWRRLFIIILFVLLFAIPVFMIIWKLTFKKQIEKVLKNNPAPKIDFENMGLSPREKEICGLLLTELSIKQIAYALKITYSGVNYHIKNIYQKLNINKRAELFIKF
ncbi:MAG: helix-turn-helix transcriptional regulator [Treponema sp.]|nr:helix-turn-helix transcriptional regulator [Treponema sp.]